MPAIAANVRELEAANLLPMTGHLEPDRFAASPQEQKVVVLPSSRTIISDYL